MIALNAKARISTVHSPLSVEGRTEPRGGWMVMLNLSAPLANATIASMPVTNFAITSRNRPQMKWPLMVIRPC